MEDNTEVTTEGNQNNHLEALTQLAHDYASYLNVDTEKERKEFDDKLEGLLTQLEEYCTLMDTIRSDTSLCLNRTLPQIHTKSLEIQELFDKIDKLEVFVQRVKQNVTEMEVLIDQAESEVLAKNPVVKFFSSLKPKFFSSQKAPPPSPVRFVPPVIFRTEDYLGASS